MKESEQQQTERFIVYLTPCEAERFRTFLSKTGRGISSFLRNSILQSIENWEYSHGTDVLKKKDHFSGELGLLESDSQ